MAVLVIALLGAVGAEAVFNFGFYLNDHNARSNRIAPLVETSLAVCPLLISEEESRVKDHNDFSYRVGDYDNFPLVSTLAETNQDDYFYTATIIS